MVMLTIINMFLIFTETQRYFVFSAFIPYRILYEAAFFTGLMPESFYEPLIGENESLEFFSIKPVKPQEVFPENHLAFAF